jgi:hypothetical protein
MKYRVLIALLVLGFCVDLGAEESSAYPRVSFIGPGRGGPPVGRDQFIMLVVEGPYISYEKNPIPENGVVAYVNNLLKMRNVSSLAVYGREGAKYGDIVKAIDVLRKTDAKDIGVSMVEVPAGREP